MHNIERRVWREARAMTRREVIRKAITKQLTWVQASEILGISARHMRRLRCKVERWGMSAVMGQRGGRRRCKCIKAGTIESLWRLKREVYADFLLRHYYEHVTEKHGVKDLVRLAAADAAGSRSGAAGTRARPVSAPAQAAGNASAC